MTEKAEKGQEKKKWKRQERENKSPERTKDERKREKWGKNGIKKRSQPDLIGSLNKGQRRGKGRGGNKDAQEKEGTGGGGLML